MNKDTINAISSEMALVIYNERLQEVQPLKTISDYRKEQYIREKNTTCDYNNSYKLPKSQRSINKYVKKAQDSISVSETFSIREALIARLKWSVATIVRDPNTRISEITYKQLIICISRLTELEKKWDDSLAINTYWEKVCQKNFEAVLELMNVEYNNNIQSEILFKLCEQNISHVFSSSLFNFLCTYQKYSNNKDTYSLLTKIYFGEFNPYYASCIFYRTVAAENWFFNYLECIFNIALSGKPVHELPDQLKILSEKYQIDTDNLSLNDQIKKLDEIILCQEEKIYSQTKKLENIELEEKIRTQR